MTGKVDFGGAETLKVTINHLLFTLNQKNLNRKY